MRVAEGASRWQVWLVLSTLPAAQNRGGEVSSPWRGQVCLEEQFSNSLLSGPLSTLKIH